jgi:hypothetical protein
MFGVPLKFSMTAFLVVTRPRPTTELGLLVLGSIDMILASLSTKHSGFLHEELTALSSALIKSQSQ